MKLSNGIRGGIAYIIIVVGFILLIEFGYADFLRLPLDYGLHTSSTTNE